MQQLSGLKRAGRGDKFALQLAPGSMQFSSTSLSVLEKACGGRGGRRHRSGGDNQTERKQCDVKRNSLHSESEGKQAEEGELEGSLAR